MGYPTQSPSVVTVTAQGLARASVAYVNGTTPDGIGTRATEDGVVELQPHAVAVVSTSAP